MGFQIRGLTLKFAAEISGLNLANPVKEQDKSSLKKALCNFAVLVICGQEALTKARMMEFASLIGHHRRCRL